MKDEIDDKDAEVRDWIQIVAHQNILSEISRLEKTIETNFSSRHPSSWKLCLGSLAFLETDSRAHDVDHAAPGTCKWLIQRGVYKDWKNPPRQIGFSYFLTSSMAGVSCYRGHPSDASDHFSISSCVAYLTFGRAHEVPPTIPKTIVERANGIFLRAQLVTDQLFMLEREGVEWETVEARRRSIPEELDNLYEDIFRDAAGDQAFIRLIPWPEVASRRMSEAAGQNTTR
ncbi:hypothetical protein F5Y17DRAFT_455941 [Xylariaceae sp. FL0594]|nr:hypothetical protein F5Y17DRAFT_455941 [Xylariaceae sp. FL0594]